MIDKESVFHISGFNDCYPLSTKKIRVRVRTKKNNVEKAVIVYQNIYSHVEETLKKLTMIKLNSDKRFDYYEADISIEEGYFKYYFELYNEKVNIFCQDGFLKEINEENYFYYPEAHQSDVFALPEWAKGVMIYQIIIDRFNDGNLNNNPANCKPWNTIPDRNTYYGGDFEGIINKLGYIKSLGADAIYLNPIHPSMNYHKYDITNYEEIDKEFGGLKELKSLIKRAHQEGLKIILDGVFNHCSSKHPFFIDLLNNQEKSIYKNWFKVHEFPVSVAKANYDNFGNLVPIMPKFDTSNSNVIEYLTGIAKYWTKELKIDGWRLDVGDELSHEFLRDFRKRIKSVNSNVLIIGESWNIASRFMLGDQFDTITNYKNRNLILELVNHRISGKEFFESMCTIKMQYKSVANPYLINLVGSHDTIRLASYFNDDRKRIVTLILLMFLEGGFVLYYGDEVGLQGGDDPDNRRSMNWDLEVDELIKKVLQIRKTTEFYKGDFIGETLINNCIFITRGSNVGKICFIGNITNKDVEIEYKSRKVLLESRKCIGNVLKPFDFIILKK